MATFVPVTFDCNDHCISCPVKRRGKRDNPSLDEIKQDIDKIAENSKHLEFNGGEPMLRDDIFDILDYATDLEISLLSNVQSFAYAGLAKKISKYNLKIITTLYGHNSQLHDAITRTPGSFMQKIEGIRNLRAHNVPIELRILIHKMNYRFIGEISDFIINNFSKSDFCMVVIMNPKLSESALKHKSSVSINMSKIADELEDPIQQLDDAGFNVVLYHFPFCVLPKMLWEYSFGLTSDDSEVSFTDVCKKCDQKKDCARIWTTYLDLFGDSEFKAIHQTYSIKPGYIKQPFYEEKLYFSLGLKPVMRLDIEETFDKTVEGFTDFHLCRSRNHVFVSKDLALAREAKVLSTTNFTKIQEIENKKINKRIGILYGYPACCAKHFNPTKKLPEFNCNGKKLSLLYYPCSDSCKKTEELKQKIIKKTR